MATFRKAPFVLFSCFISSLVASLTLPESSPAQTIQTQVITDGSLGGASGPVTPVPLPNGKIDVPISESLGKRAGSNLFHSFSTFNITGGDSATFSGSSGIQNVVSRVTGGTYSTIDGTLRSTIEGANLYFLNPWGVLFGPNASLDVKGSFHVSTADYLRFDDGFKFYSTPNPTDQVLSTASPVAFGFLNANPSPMYAVQSFLEVPAGETLSVVGGDIGLYGAYLWAPSGRVNLASMASAGEVIPSPAGSTPDLHVQPLTALGTLGIDASVLDVSDYSEGNPSGTILIRAGRLVLDHGSWITADNYGDPFGGSVNILAGSLDVSGGSSISVDSEGTGKAGELIIEATESVRLSDITSSLSSAAWASGDAGTIALTTPDLLIENEAAIYGDSFGDGRGGDVTIVAGKVTLSSGGSISSNASGGTGNGGNISITATDRFSISGRGPNGLDASVENRTSGAGNAGRIQISTPILDIGEHGSISAETLGTGHAGDIDIATGTLNLSGGGRISNSAFGTAGNGGDIFIRATDSVTISGTDSQQGIPSGLFSYSWEQGQGDAGGIFLSAPDLVLTGGASIGADTFGDGRAGNIELDVQRLTLSGGANITSGSLGGSGRGGDIHVAATDALTLSGLFSDISTSTAGDGDGGNIAISTNTLTLQDQGAIYADTIGSGQGGDIGLQVTSLSMSGGSRISSSTFDSSGDGGSVTVQAVNEISLTGAITGIGSVSSGSGKGGDIQLRAAELGLADGAQITASSTGTGDAGNIDIAVSRSFTSRTGKVSTSSKNADGGNIDITAPYMVHLKDSEITASVGGGPTTVGGNISIDPQYVILDHSRIIANAFEGQGGNIRIVANVFLADPYSVVDASSALGIDGTVDIRAPITEISGTLVPLGEDFISAFELLREPCMARIRGGKYSSFIVGGRDGLPIEPGRLLPSPMP